MAWLDKAGYDDSIIHLPHALPARGDKLLLKAKMGTAEMRLETRDPIAAERNLATLIAHDWRTTRARDYAGIEIAVGSIDPTAEFADLEPSVREFLEALASLQRFCHQPEVARTIEQNRGTR